VIIMSGKRAPRGNPYDGEGSDSDTEWWTPPPKSSPAVGHASGSHSGVDMSSSSSGGSESPLLTPGSEVPLDPEGAFKPGTTTEDQPASSSKTKSVSWSPLKNVKLPSGQIISEPLVPPEIKPLPLPPGRDGYLAKVASTQQSPSPEIEHASPSSYFDLPPSPKPQSKGFVSNFKTYFGKLGKLNFGPTFQRVASNFKTLFGKLGTLKFRPRFQRAVDTGTYVSASSLPRSQPS
jgi:hypothetical protein